MKDPYYKYLMDCSLSIKCKDCDFEGLCRECYRKDQKEKQQKQLTLINSEEAQE